MTRFPLFIAAALLAGSAAWAQQPQSETDRIAAEAQRRLQEASEFQRQAGDMGDETRNANARIAELSAAADEKEAALRQIRERLADYEARDAAARENLRRNQDQYNAIFSAMVAMSKTPQAAMMAHAERPLDMARSRSMMDALDDGLRRRAQALGELLAELEGARRSGAAARAEAEAAIEALHAEEKALQSLIEERSVQTEDALARAAASQREADLLRSRLDEIHTLVRIAPRPRLRGERRPRPPQAGGPIAPNQRNPFIPADPLTNARGSMVPPVAGRILIPYGGPLAGGGASEGVLFEAAPRARVFAPWGGRVSYAGPLETFGLVVVIDAGEGMQIVLAGLGDTHLRNGDFILRGDVVGRLGGPRPPSAGGAPVSVASLYLEIRRGGRPSDPNGWLTRA